MEAIEFELADPKWHAHRVCLKRVDEIEDSFAGRAKFSDLGLAYGLAVAYGDQTEAVHVIDVVSERTALLPAELVFLPYRPTHGGHMFGSSTNGLASGNSELEATIHATCEVIERHVSSFNYVKDESQLVELETLPTALRSTVERIQEAGLDVSLRYTPNDFHLPYFQAAVLERSDYAPLAIAGGCGVHPIAAIAASRALTEAVQSRLTGIHGGRDDVIDRFDFFATKEPEYEVVSNASQRSTLMNGRNTSSFSTIPDYSARISSVDECYQLLIATLHSQGFPSIMRSVLSPPDAPFSVVKVIVPQMEFCGHGTTRMGPRLLRALEELPSR
jgi:ribosomal protein S12 methylthiotransferase accessory factor